MKHISKILVLALLIMAGCVGEDQKGSVRVMSLNIRMDTPVDAENSWPNRRDFLVDNIINQSPDVIGFQEVLHSQLSDLDSLLPWYDYIGVGRDDGKLAGEFSPVFYKMNRFDLLDHGTIWLSPYPDSIGSIGWDAAITRIMSWAKFHDRHIRKDFYFLNTHFDHVGDTARFESIKRIMDFIITATNGFPVVLSGDFNLEPDTEAIEFLLESDMLSMYDAFTLSVTGNKGHNATFNGFGKAEPEKRIDYIFVNDAWKCYEHQILALKNEGLYISDHYPVVANIKIKAGIQE